LVRKFLQFVFGRHMRYINLV